MNAETLSSLAWLYPGGHTKRNKATSMPKPGQNIPLIVLSVLPSHHNPWVQTMQFWIKWLPVGGLLHRRRSFKKKHLRKISTEANIARRYTPKLPSRELRHSNMPWDEGLHRLKEEKTNRPMVICVMIVTSCRGYKCNFDRAASRAYVLFTLTCICSCVTLGLFAFCQAEGTNVIQYCSYLFMI
jgi:hypothetical protein